MARRNNLTLEEVVDKANSVLMRSKGSELERHGVIGFVNELLHYCDNHGGFVYLDSTQVPPGEKPGIVRGINENGELDNEKNEYPDETRIQFLLMHRNSKNDKKSRLNIVHEFPISFIMEIPELDKNGQNRIVGRFSVRNKIEEQEIIASVKKIYPQAIQSYRKEDE